MNKNFLSVIFILLGLSLLGVIVYFIFFHDFSAPEVTVPGNKNINTLTQKEPVVKKEEQKSAVQSVKTTSSNAEDDLKRLALSFAERFGSFSNQAGYQHIKDLKIFMSSSMGEWADQYIQDEISKNISNTIYYGINTKAVSAKIQDLDIEDGTAKILISTQRAESTGSTGNISKFAQNIIISFVKEKGAWKVSGAHWQTK